jgi:tellurite resistance protein
MSTPLKFLYPGWYATVMGLCGMALAFHRASPIMGELAGAASLALGGLAALVMLVLLGASLLRLQRHPGAWTEDARHPVRHAFIAAAPIGLLLLATVAVANGLHHGALHGAILGLWWAGSVLQLVSTVWVLARWWKGNQAGGLVWASVTPALFIPIVGNVLAPLAGVPLGLGPWSAAQLGVGLLFWPVIMVLLVVRIALQGLWPERLLPAAFIVVAPPSVVGLSLLQLGAPVLVAWPLWGMALFSAAWCALLLPRIAAMPFGLPHWGMSFPLAALAALTLRLVPEAGAAQGLMQLLGITLLATTALVLSALVLGTVRGLRDGSLLAPELAAPIVAAASPADTPRAGGQA